MVSTLKWNYNKTMNLIHRQGQLFVSTNILLLKCLPSPAMAIFSSFLVFLPEAFVGFPRISKDFVHVHVHLKSILFAYGFGPCHIASDPSFQRGKLAAGGVT